MTAFIYYDSGSKNDYEEEEDDDDDTLSWSWTRWEEDQPSRLALSLQFLQEPIDKASAGRDAESRNRDILLKKIQAWRTGIASADEQETGEECQDVTAAV